MKRYLGVDVGSYSVKAVLMRYDKTLIKWKYIRNTGIIESINELIKSFKNYPIHGIGVTGSGRDFANIFLEADLVENEIVAHSVASSDIMPEVRTIFEVGGEDAKLTQVRNGIIENFMMNSQCSAGTGALIETIANRLGFQIDEVSDIALKSKTPISISSKCGVFAQSMAINKRNMGFNVSDIMASVCRSVVENYFTILVRNNILHPPYMFQGATARNKALVKYFKEMVNDNVIVPTFPEYTGCIGTALIMREKKIDNIRQLKLDQDYKTEIRIGDGCSNHCEIIIINGKGAIGNRCDKCLKS